MKWPVQFGLLLVLQLWGSIVVGSQMIRTVAVSRQSVPGVPGNVTFDRFSVPLLNASGEIAFAASLTGSNIWRDSGIWAGDPESLSVVMRAGDQAFGLPDGVRYNGFFDVTSVSEGKLVFNSNGQVAFIASLTGSGVNSSNDYGIWSGAIGASRLVFRAGDQIPGTLPGVTFGEIGELTVNSSGQMAFQSRLQGSGITGWNSEGIWSEGPGALSLIARTGDQAPGLPPGVFYSGLGSEPVINTSGHVAFQAGLNGSHPEFSNNFSSIKSVWTDRLGSPTLVARGGELAPDTTNGVVFDWVGWDAPAVLNSADRTAFSASLQGEGISDVNDHGIWSDRLGAVSVVVRAGDAAPIAPGGVTFGGVFEPVMNSAGAVTFFSYLAGNGVNSSNEKSIWSDGSGSLKLVAREGDQAPGLPPGVVFNSFESFTMINDAGQSAFGASFRGSSSGYGIWAQDRSGRLQLIVRDGDQLEVAPGDWRTVESIDIEFFTHGDAYAFNALGQVAFRARFTDRSYGIFISNLATIPEPSSLMLLASPAVMLLAARSRKHVSLPRV
jgi:hypothetical protein